MKKQPAGNNQGLNARQAEVQNSLVQLHSYAIFPRKSR
jgi:hypothetical protein